MSGQALWGRLRSGFVAALRRRTSVESNRPGATAGAGATTPRFESLERRTLMAGDTALPSVGTNLDALTYYNPAWVFNDAFKAASPWSATAVDVATGKPGEWGKGGPVSVNANGWPTELRTWTDESGKTWRQRLDTLIYRDIGGHYPAGRYTATWEGKGHIGFGGGGRVVSETANSAVVNITPANNGIWLYVDQVDPADPIRNIRLWAPDYDGQSFAGKVWAPGADFSPFHPEFVERLKPFDTIRFMDWGRTNGSPLQTWDQRRTLEHYTQADHEDKKGVAYEYMVALVNELDADAWVNIPHAADDNFVRSMAEMFKNGLEPGRKVYLEWSNEIWNTAKGFTTFPWLTEQKALFPGKDEMEVAAQHIQTDFDIWSQVWSDRPDQLVRVVAGQASNGYQLENLLHNMGGKFDAVAVTGYIQANNKANFDGKTTAEQVVKDVIDSVPGSVAAVARAKEQADRYGRMLGRDIKVLTYEGGQHLDAHHAPFQSAFYAAQTHPLMYQAYKDLLQGFADIGGDMFTHYTFVSQNAPAGSWGSLQYMTQPTSEAPKHRALVEAAQGTLFQTEYRIEAIQPQAAEFGDPIAGQFKITRLGDRSAAADVALAVGGSAGAGDYAALPAGVRFEPGEASKVVDLIPVDDGEVESAEFVDLALAGVAGIDPRYAAARVEIADDDDYAVRDLKVRNRSFEDGDLDGWSVEGRTSMGVANRKVDNAPAAAHDGSRFAWAAGSGGSQRFGDKVVTLSQQISLDADHVKNGGSRLTLSAWGAGGGASLDAAKVEIRFFNKGKQIGDAAMSRKTTSNGQWGRMVVDAPVPSGAKSAEIRLFAERRSGDSIMNVGLDDVRATLRTPKSAGVGSSRPPVQAPITIPPGPFMIGDVGAPADAGSTTVLTENSAYDLLGPAGDVGGRTDQFHFVHQQRTGDFDVKVRLAALSSPDNAGTAVAGLMVRSGLDAGSANVFARLQSGTDTKGRHGTSFGFSSRKADGAGSKGPGKAKNVAALPDAWLRLKRKGNTFAAYRSTDGGKWKKLGSAKIKMAPTVFFGLAANAQAGATSTAAQFRDLTDVPVPVSTKKRG